MWKKKKVVNIVRIYLTIKMKDKSNEKKMILINILIFIIFIHYIKKDQ